MPRVVERVFTAPEQMAATAGRMTSRSVCWAGRMRCLEVDGVRVDYVELDPYELDVPPLHERPDQPVRMMLSIILEGVSTGTVGGHPLTLCPRQAAILDGRAEMHFRSESRVRALRLFVEEDHLPPDALMCPSLQFAVLKHTPLVIGCVGLINGLLQVASPEIVPHDEVAFSRPLIALMAALLDEALHDDSISTAAAAPAFTDPVSRRARVEAYIEQHLTDPVLTPSHIAAALGLHIRTLHAIYEDSTDTVAGRIRARRVAEAQALLRRRDEPPHIATLATRLGLTTKRLTEAFQAETGHTARQWWELHHETPHT